MLLQGDFKITPIIKKAVPFLEQMIPRLPGGSANSPSLPATYVPDPPQGPSMGMKLLIGGGLLVGGIYLFRSLRKA